MKKVQLSHLPLAFECREIVVVTGLGVLELLTEPQPDERPQEQPWPSFLNQK